MRFATFINTLKDDPYRAHLDNDPNVESTQDVEIVFNELCQDFYDLAFRYSHSEKTDAGLLFWVQDKNTNEIRTALISKGWVVAQYRSSIEAERAFTFMQKQDKIIMIEKSVDDNPLANTRVIIPHTHHVRIRSFDDVGPNRGPITNGDSSFS